MNRENCLETAKACVTQDRQNDYGKPENNFQNIANLWNAYFGKEIVNSTDVSILLMLLKVARLKTSPHKEDNWVDIAGYAACGCEISTLTIDK